MRALKFLCVVFLFSGLLFQANTVRSQDASDKLYWVDPVKIDIVNECMDLKDFDATLRWFMTKSGKKQIKIEGVANHVFPYQLVINVNKNVGVANLKVYDPFSEKWYTSHSMAEVPSDIYEWDWVYFHGKWWPFWYTLIVEIELK
jgi:hypothetical protein